MCPTTTMSSQSNRVLFVPNLERDLLTHAFARQRRDRAHGLNRPALPPDHLADVSRLHRYFDQRRPAMIALRYDDALRRIGEGLRDGLDNVADRRHAVAPLSATGAGAVTWRFSSVRTVSDSWAPLPTQ